MKGDRRKAFRAKVETELTGMGFRRAHWQWQDAPAGLLMIVRGELRHIELRANMGREKLARELGRLQGWADLMFTVPAQVPAQVIGGMRQIDLVDWLREKVRAAG